jgi:hypothetical protein
MYGFRMRRRERRLKTASDLDEKSNAETEVVKYTTAAILPYSVEMTEAAVKNQLWSKQRNVNALHGQKRQQQEAPEEKHKKGRKA